MPELLLQKGQVRRNLEQEKGFWWGLLAGGPVGPGARKQEAPLSNGLTEHWTSTPISLDKSLTPDFPSEK